MSGICDTCKRDECYMQHDGDDSCPLYIKGKPSNYKKLFGTPERAARTITQMQMATDLMGCCDAQICPAAFEECWKLDSCPMEDCDTLLEWLRSDA